MTEIDPRVTTHWMSTVPLSHTSPAQLCSAAPTVITFPSTTVYTKTKRKGTS